MFRFLVSTDYNKVIDPPGSFAIMKKSWLKPLALTVAILFTSLQVRSQSTETLEDRFTLNIRVGLNQSSVEVHNSNDEIPSSFFKDHQSISAGVEMEFNLSNYNYNWKLLLEPTYTSFKDSQIVETSAISGGTLETRLNHSTLEVPVGIRYYVKLSDGLRIFLNPTLMGDIGIGSNQFLRADGSVRKSYRSQLAGAIRLGGGLKYKERYSIEYRATTSRKIFGDHLFQTENYLTNALVIGIRILGDN